MKIKISIFLIPVLCFFTFGCDQGKSEEKPEYLIAEDDYIQLLVEFQLIRTHYNSQPKEVNLDSVKNAVYQKYNVDEEQFRMSNRYYQKQVEGQIRRANKAIEWLEIELQKFEEDSAETKKRIRE